MNLKQFFSIVATLRKSSEDLSEKNLEVLDSVLGSQADIISKVEKESEHVKTIEELTSKNKELMDDNFKFRERARKHEEEIETRVEKATKKLTEQLNSLQEQVKSAQEAAAEAHLRSELLASGIQDDLVDKALRLVDDTHFEEKKSKNEDGEEIVSRTFDRDKFREDNEIFYGNVTKVKGVGGAGKKDTKVKSFKDSAEKYLASQYYRPDRKEE